MNTRTFYKVGPGQRTVEEWDEAARTGEVIASFGYSYRIPDIPEGNIGHPDLEIILVNRQGMGNHGRFVLRGKTPRGRALVRQGKIARLVGAGCPKRVAQAAVSVQYGMEEAVWKMVQLLTERGIPAGSTRAELQRERFELGGLSIPRYRSAVEIALRCGAQQLQPEEYRYRYGGGDQYGDTEPLTLSLGEVFRSAGITG